MPGVNKARYDRKRNLKEAQSMETGRSSEGILSEEMKQKRDEIIELLKTAYFMELETVISYVTNST
ncbi:MAG: hypothetical protein M3272_00775, partial [Actinomycetota bacterium]|nr:hypothetical protein [Actinomycetota bacterium]